MPRISLLPEDVFSRIAAGEIVERPASVVKEAVENSIDAGAGTVRVFLFEGGKLRIVVEDDGTGIPFDELPLAAARHATSKIRSVEDLEKVATLGFRGEALASMAAVSRFEIRSRCRGAELGGLLRVEGGSLSAPIPTPCREGTRISVEDLFFNLPARRKFLKTAASEGRRVSTVLRDLAVAYPSVSFTEVQEGKTVFSSPGTGDRRETLRLLWGEEADIRSCSVSTANLSLECWWNPLPGKGKNSVTAYVNGRVVNDGLIRGAAASLCRDLPGNWAFLFSLEPVLVDVNIHPAKAEVRFRYPGEVYDTVQQAALSLSRGSLPLSMPVRSPFVPFPAAAGVDGEGRGSFSWRASSGQGMSSGDGNLFGRGSDAPDIPEFPAPGPSRTEAGNLRFLGQTGPGYLVFETEEGIAIMDPHAAHERVTFEREKKLSRDSVAVQHCAVPLPVPPTFSISVREHLGDLEKEGFLFGEEDGMLLLRGFPALPETLGGDPLRLLRSVLLEWTEDRRAPLGEILWKQLSTVACGMSVKLGDGISPQEAVSLWRDLAACETPLSCPHGRPTMLSLDVRKLRSYFGRE